MYLFYDTETSDLPKRDKPLGDLSQPSIIQLSAMLFGEDEKLQGELNCIIKPNGWTIAAGAQGVHGISLEHCEKFGIPILSALSVFNYFLKKAVVTVAHNHDFDHKMMDIEVAKMGKPSIIDSVASYCTMKESTNIVKIPNGRGGYKWPRLTETYRFLFNEDFDGAHSASSDTIACARCFFELKKRGHAQIQKVS